MTDITKINKMLCGLDAEVVEGEDLEKLKKTFTWARDGIIMIRSLQCIMPLEYLMEQEKFFNFKFRPTDVFVTGYQRTGTTWLQEIVWTLIHNPNLDHHKASKSTYCRAPWFESDCGSVSERASFMKKFADYIGIENPQTFSEVFERYEDPRVFKSHMQCSLVNPKQLEISKVVYIFRHPLDTFLSLYKFYQVFKFHGFVGSCEEFRDLFLGGDVVNGNSISHFLDWWQHRNNKNFHLVLYENLKQNSQYEIRRLAKFLGRELTDDQLNNILQYTQFDTMKKNFAVIEQLEDIELFYNIEQYKLEGGGFFRKGLIGDSKYQLPKKVYNDLADYCQKTLNRYDLPYDYSKIE